MSLSNDWAREPYARVYILLSIEYQREELRIRTICYSTFIEERRISGSDSLLCEAKRLGQEFELYRNELLHRARVRLCGASELRFANFGTRTRPLYVVVGPFSGGLPLTQATRPTPSSPSPAPSGCPGARRFPGLG